MEKIETEKFVPYWVEYKKIMWDYLGKISSLEKKMQQELGNDKLEFFGVDGEIVGIGTSDREMELIHDRELDRLTPDEDIKQ
jgi:hypothetical protein